MKKTIIILYNILVCTLLYGQEPQPNFTLTTQEPPDQTRDYLASEFIHLMPSFHADPNSGKFVRAHIDPLMVFPPEEGEYGGPNPGDDGVVGTLPGGVSVSPIGGATYSVPIEIPVGTGGMTPSISLVYNSQAGNGLLGWGWSMAGLSSISRTATSIYLEGYIDGVDFDDNDQLALDGQKLLPINEGTEYRTEIETFSQVIPKEFNNGWPTWFEVRTKDGRIIEYGRTPDSRIEAQGRTDVLTWLVNCIYDRKGNYIKFEYVEDQGLGKIGRILYTGNSETGLQPYYIIKFLYTGNRIDPIRTYISGSEIHIDSLLTSIEINYNSSLVKKYDLQFEDNYYVSHLKSIKLSVADGEHYNPTKVVWTETEHGLCNDCVEYVYTTYDSNYMQVFLDFSGDGKTDMIELRYDTTDSGIKYKDWKLRVRHDGYFGTPTDMNWGIDNYVYLFLNGDFNGDGYEDIALFNRLPDINWAKLGLIMISRGDHFDFYTVNDIAYCIDDGLEISKGDLNGDGIDEIIVAQKDIIWHPDGTNTIVFEFNPTNPNYLDTLFETWVQFGGFNTTEEQFLVGDFTGDSKLNILSTISNPSYPNSTHYYLYEANQDMTGLDLIYDGITGDFLRNDARVFQADFNGDRITDIASFHDANWEFFIFNGKDDFLPFDAVPNEMWQVDPLGEVAKYYYKTEFSDYNGDGFTDIAQYHDLAPSELVEYKIFYGNGTYFEYITGTFEGDGIQLQYQIVGHYTPTYEMHKRFYEVNDFNGDGKADFYHYRKDVTPDRIYNFELTNNPYNLVTSFTNGFGLGSYINYLPLTNSAIYSKGSNAQYPLVDIQGPLYVISNLQTEDGIGGYLESDYLYEGAQCHQKGKGFLGYQKIISITDPNSSHTKKTESFFSFDPPHYINVLDSTHIYLDKPNGELEKILSTFNEKPIINDFEDNERIFYYTPVSLSKFYHTGDESSYYIKTVRQEQYFDGDDDMLYGNVSETRTYIDESEHELDDPVSSYKYSTFNSFDYDYSKVDIWLISLVNNIYTEIKSDQDPTNSIDQRSVVFTHDGNTPLVKSKQVVPNGSYSHTINEIFDYDHYGNIIKSTVSAPNSTPPLNPRIIDFDYSLDYQCRFITGKRQSVNNTIFSESYLYYPLQGLPSTYTDINGLVTTYFYNSLGSLIKTILPDKNEKHEALRWSENYYNNPYWGLFLSWSKRSGEPSDTTFYDKLSRKLLSVTTDFNGNDVFIVREYDEAGQLLRQSEPYFRGEQILWTNYSYLTGGEVKTMHSPTINLEFTHNGRTEFTNNLNTEITTVKSYDALGNLIMAGDPSGIITYDYLSSGKLYQIHYNNNTSTFTYDDAGFQESISDPNAGLIQYDYNPFGDLVKQQDSKGNTYEMKYDELGRMKEKQLQNSSHVTYYLYDQDVNGKGKLSWAVNTWNGMSTHYTYNNLSRLSSSTERIDNVDYNFTFTYDIFGNIKTKTWPDNFSLLYHYRNGYLGKIIEPSTGTTIWELNELNSKGMITQERLGNGLTTTKSYNSSTGYLTDIQTGQVQHLSYYFDEQTGTLTWREDQLIPGILHEDFTYDGQLKNRLETWQVQGKTLYSIDYDNNGNFNSKTDVGTEILYGPQPGIASFAGPNALAKVNYPDASFLDASKDIQEIYYTSFNKTQQVVNTKTIVGNTDVYSLTIDYGPDENRRVSRLVHNGNQILKKTFTNNEYEIETDDLNNTRFLHYITGGDGLCAVYITDNENQRGNIYYILKDHIGSIYGISDQQGEIVNYYGERQIFSFDPWGRRRNPNDWTYNNVPNQFLLDRGFTLHEHLDEIGLINMNGRMYDPWLGRFCSPDNFVQLPDYSQNLNRYSYCLNNPLSYHDPDGQFIQLLAGAFIGGLSNWFANGAEFSWNGLGYFGVGAAAGALGAGIGAGISSVIGGGTFGAGFIGSSSAAMASTSFVSGAAIGAGAGFATGFVAGFGNSLIQGKDISTALGKGSLSGVYGGLSGTVIGGLTGGILSDHDNRDFWTGGEKAKVYISPIGDNFGKQNGECALRCLEEFSDSYGMDQYDYNYWLQQNGNQLGVDPRDLEGLIDNTGVFSSDRIIGDKNTIADCISHDQRVLMGFNTLNGKEHAIMVSKIKIWPSGRFKIWFAETSPVRIAPYSTSNLHSFNNGYGFWSFFPL